MNWRLARNEEGQIVLQRRIKAEHPGALEGWETIAKSNEIAELCNVLDHWQIEK
jgi:hypothetical protein